MCGRSRACACGLPGYDRLNWWPQKFHWALLASLVALLAQLGQFALPSVLPWLRCLRRALLPPASMYGPSLVIAMFVFGCVCKGQGCNVQQLPPSLSAPPLPDSLSQFSQPPLYGPVRRTKSANTDDRKITQCMEYANTNLGAVFAHTLWNVSAVETSCLCPVLVKKFVQGQFG